MTTSTVIKKDTDKLQINDLLKDWLALESSSTLEKCCNLVACNVF